METRCNGVQHRRPARARVSKQERRELFRSDVGMPLWRRLLHWGPLLAIFITVTVSRGPGWSMGLLEVNLILKIIHPFTTVFKNSKHTHRPPQ